MRAVIVAGLLIGLGAHAQTLQPDGTSGLLARPTTVTNVGRVIRALGVSVAIPAIAANSTAIVAVSGVSATINGVAYQPQPGDEIGVSLAVGSATVPANVGIAGMFCGTAGTISLRYANISTLGASTATTITVNAEWTGP